MMIARLLVIGLVFSGGVAASACSRDPQEEKQRYLTRGDAYVAEGKDAEAALAYRRAAEADHTSADALLKLADTYGRLNEPARLLRELVRAADLLPNDVEVQLKAGNALLLAGRFEEARSRADRVIAAKPDDIRGLLLLGNARAGMKDADGAMQEIEEAMALDPADSRPYALAATVQLAQGDTRGAEEAFRKALALNPNDVAARLTYGTYCWLTGRVEEAEQHFRQAHAQQPESVATNRALAMVYASTDRLAEAEPFLKKLAEVAGPRPKLALADYYVTVGRPADAVGVLQGLASDKTVAADAAARIAAIDFAAGRTTEALARLDDILAKERNNLRARLLKARILVSDPARLGEALAEVDSALSGTPRSAPAHYMRGVLLAARREYSEAEKAFAEAIGLQPKAVAAQLRIAEVYLALGRPDRAVEFAGTAVRLADSVEARAILARAHLMQNDVAAAERALAPVLRLPQHSPDVQVLAGNIRAGRGDAAGARAAFEKALAAAPHSPEALNGLLALDTQARRLGEAVARIEHELAAAPDHTGVLMVAARTYGLVNDLERAERALRRAIELDPQNMAAYTSLGQLFIRANRLDEARAEFERVANGDAASVAAPTMVATILHMQNRLADALKWYERALGADPRAAVAANNLAWLYAEGHGDIDAAVRLALIAVERLPEVAEVNDTLGWAYYRKGLSASAIAPLQRSVRLDPRNPLYAYHLGLAYAKDGRKEDARKELQRALVLNERFAGADEARKILETL